VALAGPRAARPGRVGGDPDARERAGDLRAGAEANRVQVRFDGAGRDAGPSPTSRARLLTAPDGCTRTATATDATVTCPAAGLTTVVIRTGDGADSVAASASASPPFGLQVALGPADDRLDVLAGVAIAVARRGRQRQATC
jgi:hypothetical protein